MVKSMTTEDFIQLFGGEEQAAKMGALTPPVQQVMGIPNDRLDKAALRNDVFMTSTEWTNWLSGDGPLPELKLINVKGIDAYEAGWFMGCPCYIEKEIANALIEDNQSLAAKLQKEWWEKSNKGLPSLITRLGISGLFTDQSNQMLQI
jgi:hypothetical protein